MAIPFLRYGITMNRFHDITFRGKRLRLYLSMSALLDVQEAYDVSFNELFDGTEREVFDRKCFLFSLLSYEGKRLYPEQNFDTIAIMDMDDVLPFEYIDISEAINKSVELAFKRDFLPEEVDEGLLELKKKRNTKKQEQKSIEQGKS